MAAALAGCGGGGGGGLGGDAEVIELAAAELAEIPAGPLVWIAEEVLVAPGGVLEHAHDFAFIYAKDGAALLEVEDEQLELASGEGGVVPGGTRHLHRAGGSRSTFWEIRLAPPDAPALPGSRQIFRSETLRGIPEQPLASFLLVRVPPGGETSVHTHPGPELIYQLTGRILYQNALIGTVRLGPGGLEGIPRGTPVQKRNRSGSDAVFLSWFLVDPKQPFAPGAEFRAGS